MINKEFSGMEKLSLVDFDDHVSCALFTNGCNFRCPFCHNGLLVTEDVDEIPFEKIKTYLKKRIGIIDAVCITGGEPTLMPSLKDKIKEIKALGFLVKLDTNGTNLNVLKDLVENHLIDYVAMDIKNSPKMFNKTIGTTYDMNKLKPTIAYLLENHVDYEFRTTLVKEYHTLDHFKDIKDLIKGAKKYVLQHYVERETNIMTGLHEIKVNEALEIKKYLDNFLDNVVLRGY